MRVIKTDSKQYPVQIRDSWGGEVDLTPEDIPYVIKELKKMLDK